MWKCNDERRWQRQRFDAKYSCNFIQNILLYFIIPRFYVLMCTSFDFLLLPHRRQCSFALAILGNVFLPKTYYQRNVVYFGNVFGWFFFISSLSFLPFFLHRFFLTQSFHGQKKKNNKSVSTFQLRKSKAKNKSKICFYLFFTVFFLLISFKLSVVHHISFSVLFCAVSALSDADFISWVIAFDFSITVCRVETWILKIEWCG